MRGEGVNDTVNQGDTKSDTKGDTKQISEQHRALLELLKAKPKISRLELSGILNVGEATVSRHMKWLKDNDYIVRVGGKKEGHWKVLI